MNYPVIPRMFPTMIAPNVSRKFYGLLSALRLWTLFVAAIKLYARVVPASKHITLDGIDGGPRRPYLTRWHVIPRNPWFNIYLHYFEHGDDDRALHDHPWRSWSLLLDGRYREHTSEWMYDMPLDGSPEGVRAFNQQLAELFTPTDGRTYVPGSTTRNEGKFPGQLKFDYVQDFSTGDFRALSPDHMHLLELFGDNNEPCWTLFITGRRKRRWGFACGGNEGWRDFSKYTADHPSRPNATVGCE
ncbi:MAG: hypothetical protein ACREO4_09325 [Lysobacter sp.]